MPLGGEHDGSEHGDEGRNLERCHDMVHSRTGSLAHGSLLANRFAAASLPSPRVRWRSLSPPLFRTTLTLGRVAGDANATIAGRSYGRFTRPHVRFRGPIA